MILNDILVLAAIFYDCLLFRGNKNKTKMLMQILYPGDN